MTREDIALRVFTVITEHLSLMEPPALTDTLVDDLGADSLDAIELVMAMEEEFGIDIPDDDALEFETVRDIVEYLVTAMSEQCA